MELESKALDVAPPANRELREAFEDFLRAFEAFREANDQRLGEIERRAAADPLTEEKVARIDRTLEEQKRALDDLALAAARPALGGVPAAADPGAREHRAAFDRYVRKGDAGGLDRFEVKALSTQSDPDGGYVVPRETEAMIDRVLAKASPMRAISSVRQIGAASYRKPVATAGAESGWVGETGTRAQTAGPTLGVIEFPAMELYAMPAATQTLLDDAHVNVEQWLAEEVQIEFAEQEGAAFVLGDGVNKPRGFLTYDTVADASWSWGRLGYVASGASGDFDATDPTGALVDLVYSPKQAYRANGRWVMNRKVESAVRRLRDAEGNYIWQPGARPGESATILGYPVTEAEDMPDLAANSFSIAFGDFQRGYLVVDRVGVRVLRDPYTAKPFVLFYTTKRVGGGVQNFEAIKLMKFAAS